MRRFLSTTLVAAFVAMLAAVPANAAIKGQYVEVRSADVYTGPCFANSEENLAGNQAILGWTISEGAWKGTDLAGLGVVAVVQAHATLGDTFHNPYPAKAVVIVDSRATESQRAALLDFARAMGGRLMTDVVRVEAAPISLKAGAEHGSVTLVAGNLARIETRSLCAGDHLCGNEETYYPPLTRVAHAMPAFTLDESFKGQGLGSVWDRKDARSAFVGSFAM
jgi:uncharacterized protein DUF1326